MELSNRIILGAGLLSLLAVFVGFAAVRLGAPLLLGLIGIGMLAGEDGPGGIAFSDFQTGYLVGSIALAVILFQGGLGTERALLKRAIWPSVTLATAGVAASAGLTAVIARLLLGLSWPEGLLLGATIAPTDAAAIAVQLRVAQVRVPPRVHGALDLESGLNDPMSVFLTLGLVEYIKHRASFSLGQQCLEFFREMAGGAVLGLTSGLLLDLVFRRVRMQAAALPLVALGAALTVFAGAQMLGASGFLATYLSGVVVGNSQQPCVAPVRRFFDTLGWLAQNSLFLMLGLLVTPHRLLPLLAPAAVISLVLIFLARPASVCLCLLPFRWRVAEMAFISWGGLRGAVPIFLTMIPLLEGVSAAQQLFEIVFVATILSVAVQAPTLGLVSRALRLDPQATPQSGAPA